MKRLQGRIALITGASRGIGAAVAKRFAQEGAHVILIARTAQDLETVDDAIQASEGTATLVPLDLKEFDKIDQMAVSIAERFQKLDILVGNAGMLGKLTPLPHLKPETWETVLATNLTANFRLIRALDPLLRASAAGRAIFITSIVAREHFACWGAYSVSKAGLESMAKTYAEEVCKTNIRVNLVDPGTVNTALQRQAFPDRDPVQMTQPDEITDTFVDLASPDCTKHGEIIQVAPYL